MPSSATSSEHHVSSFLLPTPLSWPSKMIAIRKTRDIVSHRKPTLEACQRFIGPPMTRDEAERKLNHCDNFRSLVKSSYSAVPFIPTMTRTITTVANKNGSMTRRGSKRNATSSTTETPDIVDRAVALDYGNRLRSCLYGSQTKRVKHTRYTTPY